MRGKAYLANLFTVLIFPLLWVQSLRFAKAHRDDDAKAVAKVAVGIVASILVAGGGILWLTGFEADSQDGFYDALGATLAAQTGEGDYQAAVEAATIAQTNYLGAQEKRDEAEAAGDSDGAQRWQATMDEQEAEMMAQASTAQSLAPNHQLFLQVNATLTARDDAAGKALISRSTAVDDAHRERALAAYDLKDEMEGDLALTMNWMMWPSLLGIFYAPVIFAVGNVLQSTWVPSNTVGFKPYPHKAAGWFLLMGAGGVPSPFFAAWAMTDMQARAAEGQIDL